MTKAEIERINKGAQPVAPKASLLHQFHQWSPRVVIGEEGWRQKALQEEYSATLADLKQNFPDARPFDPPKGPRVDQTEGLDQSPLDRSPQTEGLAPRPSAERDHTHTTQAGETVITAAPLGGHIAEGNGGAGPGGDK